MFFSLAEAQVMIEAWRRHFNTIRPHSALGYRPPAPEATIPRGTTIAPSATAPARPQRSGSPTPNLPSEAAMH
jgi:putative transposase